MIALGASIGLLASACETVPRATAPTGVILGKVDGASGIVSVRAISQNGRTYKAKVQRDGTYRFKPLPLGTYSLKFVSDCGSWNGERIALQQGEHFVGKPAEMQACIIVGMAKIEDNRG